MSKVPLYLAHEKLPPPWEHYRALGKDLGPKGRLFLMSEVPLYLAHEKLPPPLGTLQGHRHRPRS